MRNILITQSLIENKHKELVWSLEENWYKYFQNKNINLVPLNSNFQNFKKIIQTKPLIKDCIEMVLVRYFYAFPSSL